MGHHAHSKEFVNIEGPSNNLSYFNSGNDKYEEFGGNSFFNYNGAQTSHTQNMFMPPPPPMMPKMPFYGSSMMHGPGGHHGFMNSSPSFGGQHGYDHGYGSMFGKKSSFFGNDHFGFGNQGYYGQQHHGGRWVTEGVDEIQITQAQDDRSHSVSSVDNPIDADSYAHQHNLSG
jgi:hypothetical protein